MNKYYHLFAAFALCPVHAYSSPQNGGGISVGYVNHKSYAISYPLSYTSSGFVLNSDYQFAIGSIGSAGIFASLPLVENNEGNLKAGLTTKHGGLGMEVRIWSNDFYYGLKVGQYYEKIQGSGFDTGGSGIGIGMSFGWENISGLCVNGNFGTVSSVPVFTNTDVNINSYSVNLGYRWR